MTRKGDKQAGGVGTLWAGDQPVFAFGDGLLRLGGKAVQPHEGGILALAYDPVAGLVITCGDDGAVVATSADGVSTRLYHKDRAWLDGLAIDPLSGTLAIAAGRKIILVDARNPSTPPRHLALPRAATCLSFDAGGKYLAIGHSAGVSLVDMARPYEIAQECPCGGGPIAVAMDKTGSFLFAGLSEPALAGWRMADGQGFRMGGYPAKPRHLVFDETGKLLLTSGGPALLVWPLTGADGVTLKGPMGQAAGVYRPRLGLVSAIATKGNKAAVGWSDGGVDVVDLISGQCRHLGGPRPPKDLTSDPRSLTRGIVALAFRGDGKQLSWIGETGVYATASVG